MNKIIILLFALISSSFGSDMIIVNVTNELPFNYMFSIFFNISLVLVPIFGAIALVRN